jgi:hypothetical protein
MGTNYYAFGSHSGEQEEGSGLHIGKKSAGWRFLFRAHPDLYLTSLEAWMWILSSTGVEIADEYGSEISVNELVSIMQSTEDPVSGFLRDHSEFLMEEGHFQRDGFDFCAGYFR